MFLTRIGSLSRAQFFDWLKAAAGDRVHTPSWSVHEYLRHHGDKTLEQEVTDHCRKIKALVGESLSMIQDFLDTPPGTSGDPRVRARSALVTLEEIGHDLRGWTKSYDLHAKDVIEFVNRTALDGGEPFDLIPTSRSLGAARYEGRIPPGYKDSKKKLVKKLDPDTAAVTVKGANRYGDLMFWKELLDDAKGRSAKTIVILSNDGKTDWLMPRGRSGSEDDVTRDMSAENYPVPQAHPMLSYEAKFVADIDQVFILNRHFMAQCLSRAGEVTRKATQSFIGVAVRTVNTGKLAKSGNGTKGGGRPAHIPPKVVPEAPLWKDPVSLTLSSAAIRAAIVYSGRALPAEASATAFLTRLQTRLAAGGALRDLLMGEEVAALGVELLRLGRHIHDEALNGATGYVAALSDLMASLPRCPPASAAYLYAGLMASAYLMPSSTSGRSIPTTPDTSTLFALQTAPFAIQVNPALVELLKRKFTALIYLPSSEAPPIKFDLQIGDNTVDPVLSAIECKGHLISVPTQLDSALSLNHSEQTVNATAQELLARLSAIYGYPLHQVVTDRPPDQPIEIPPHFGVIDPSVAIGDDANG